MSEKYILMGRGIPSIIPNDQTTPGTRLTATEARQYARRLVELADELNPADPPPAAQPDDGRIAEIHERLAKITPGEWEHSQTHTFHNYVQVLPAGAHQYVTICQTSTGEHSRGVPEAQFIAAAPADLRFLLARLSAVTKRAERAEKFCAEIAELSVLSSTIQYMNASADVLGKFILANPDEYRRIMTQYHAKESTDG